jgi:hypothetical protein
MGYLDEGRHTGFCVSESRRNFRMLTHRDAMTSEPQEERIYTLIAKAIAASDAEIEEVMVELRAALKEHIQRTKAMAVSSLSPRPDGKAKVG